MTNTYGTADWSDFVPIGGTVVGFDDNGDWYAAIVGAKNAGRTYWICGYCHTVQMADVGVCKNCGASREEG